MLSFSVLFNSVKAPGLGLVQSDTLSATIREYPANGSCNGLKNSGHMIVLLRHGWKHMVVGLLRSYGSWSCTMLGGV